MREIKFRGKSEKFGIWLYGSLINNAFFKSDTGEPVHYILDTNTIEYDCFEDIGEQLDEHEVVFASVGQYTGLKDKNGKEIYEGDVVNYRTFSSNENYVITIKPTGLQMINTSKYKPSFMYSLESFFEDYDGGMKSNNNVEVIGNIYENPELLEGATNGSS